MTTLDILKEGQVIAWSSLWLVDKLHEHRLVAIPRLRLGQEAALALTARLAYSRVFSGALVAVLEDPPREFIVVHASFDLYRSGEPDIVDFAIMVPVPDLPRPPVAEVITKTANMLKTARGEK